MSDKQRVRDEVLVLVERFRYGDLSSLETYWAALASSLLALGVPEWDQPEASRSPKVSEILASLPPSVGADTLSSRCFELERLSVPTSDSDADAARQSELERLSEDLESMMDNVLERVPESS